ncbi:MAG: trehalose-phosphatase [Steroidobacteraceae bacterium]
MADGDLDARPPLLSTTAALYLDFDGTLADIALHPDYVVVREPLPSLLLALRERLAGAVAVVTGRPLAAVDALIQPAHLAGAGLHGAELRLPGGNIARTAGTGAVAALVRALQQRFGDDDRLVIEDKGVGAALHFRGAPEREAECIAALRQLAATAALEILVGNRVVEARPRGANKGAALRRLAAHAPFAGRSPVFVGDDVTDEDGFSAASALGGFGVKVGAGTTVARHRIGAVRGVHEWLSESLAALANGGKG